MRTYCYKMQNGMVVERDFPTGEAPEVIDLADGVTAVRDRSSEYSSHTYGVRDRKPYLHQPRDIRSEAMSVMPYQRAEAQAEADKHGIKAHFDQNGTVHFPDMNERNKMRKMLGYTEKK